MCRIKPLRKCGEALDDGFLGAVVDGEIGGGLKACDLPRILCELHAALIPADAKCVAGVGERFMSCNGAVRVVGKDVGGKESAPAVTLTLTPSGSR